MTDTNTNTKKTVPSKAHPKLTATLKQGLLEFQNLLHLPVKVVKQIYLHKEVKEPMQD